jgi:hypothetical protein
VSSESVTYIYLGNGSILYYGNIYVGCKLTTWGIWKTLQVVFPFMTMSNKPQMNENSKINTVRNFHMLTIQTW